MSCHHITESSKERTDLFTESYEEDYSVRYVPVAVIIGEEPFSIALRYVPRRNER